MTLQNSDQFIVHRGGIDYQLAYEKLKADVLAGVEIPEAADPPGDGKLTIKDSAGNELGSFTANQAAAVDITLPAGFSGDYNDLINKPEIPEIPEYVEPPAPGDGKLTISNADGSEAGVFTANQAGDVTVTLPAGFSGDYNDLENKPEIPEVPEIPEPGDGKLTINNADGSEAGTFTANQSGDVTITLPAGASGDPVQWDDIEGKPCIPECPPECPVHQIQYLEEYTDDENVIDQSPNFDGDEPYFRVKHDPGFKIVGAKVICRTSPDGEWEARKIKTWQHYTHPDLEGEYVNFHVEDSNRSWKEASLNCSGIGEGDLVILNGRGREIGQFSANQEGDTVLRIPTDSQDYDQDPPRHPCWLHIKNVRGGTLKLRYNGSDSPLAQVDAIGVGNHVNMSNLFRETKRYMSGLMIYGMEPEKDGSKSYKCLRFGDFSAPGAMWTYPTFDGDNDKGYELLEQAGFNHKNLCGTSSTRNEDNAYIDGHTNEWLEIHSVALMKNDNDDWVEVPNHYEYLVYFWPDANKGQSWIHADPGVTYELGRLTYTTPKKNWTRFFQDANRDGGNAAPANGLRYLDVSNGEIFDRMFYNDHLMGDEPDLRFWNVGKGKSFEAMFEGCENFNADLSHWDMGNAENISKMFERARSFTCGRRESAEHGVGRWRPVNLGKTADGKGNTGAAKWAFYDCPELSADMRDWECPHVGELDDIRIDSGLRMQNYVFVRGEEARDDGAAWPWDIASKTYNDHAYYNANKFIQWPTCGPNRYVLNQYGSNTDTIAKMGYTKDFYIARKAIWQDYADWIDNAVKEGILPSWDYRTQGKVEEREVKYDECKERDDLLVEEHFNPTWGLILIKNITKPKDDYVIDEGNNLEDKPAECWCQPGQYFQIKPTWDKEYLQGEYANPDNGFKKEWAPRKTDFKWTVLEGDVTFENDEASKPKITCKGALGDVLQVQMRVTHADWEVTNEDGEPVEPPSETQTIRITLAESKP